MVVLLLFPLAAKTLARAERKIAKIVMKGIYGRMKNLIRVSHLGAPKTSPGSKDITSEAWEIVGYEVTQFCVLLKHIVCVSGVGL